MSEFQQPRREKVDPADGQDQSETFLPGQIPVSEADDPNSDFARETEQQPDPAEAAKAVNPVDLEEVEGRAEDSTVPRPAGKKGR